MNTKSALNIFVKGYLDLLRSNWSAVITDKKFVQLAVFTLLSIVPLYFYLVPYLQFVEHRPGKILNDSLLDLLQPKDVSTLIFSIQYVSATIMILYFLRLPWQLIRSIQIFIVLQYLRNLCLYFIPLGPPQGIIPLHDPVLEMIAYQHKPLLQDLFFSGHTASCVIFILLSRENFYLFIGFLMVTALIIYLLLVQHCHYTIDILGGIVFAVIAYQLVNHLWNKIKLPTG